MAARYIRGLVVAGALTGMALASAGQAVASPATSTEAHGGATNEVRESGYNHRDSVHDMPPYSSQGTWCCLGEIRESFKAIPQTTAG